MKWIELHLSELSDENLSRVSINTDKIVAFDNSIIYTVDGHNIGVKESYDDIKELIEHKSGVLA